MEAQPILSLRASPEHQSPGPGPFWGFCRMAAKSLSQDVRRDGPLPLPANPTICIQRKPGRNLHQSRCHKKDALEGDGGRKTLSASDLVLQGEPREQVPVAYMFMQESQSICYHQWQSVVSPGGVPECPKPPYNDSKGQETGWCPAVTFLLGQRSAAGPGGVWRGCRGRAGHGRADLPSSLVWMQSTPLRTPSPAWV